MGVDDRSNIALSQITRYKNACQDWVKNQLKSVPVAEQVEFFKHGIQPFEFWQEWNAQDGLWALARKYLCITASSAASERVFSDGGRTCTRFRGRQTAHTIRMLVFTSTNIRLRKLDAEYHSKQHSATLKKRKRH